MHKVSAELVIIGAGPAGLAAALAAAEAGVTNIWLLDRQTEPGGILPQCIHNGFGLRYFKEELTGPEYTERFVDQVARFPQIKIIPEAMVLEITPDRQVIAATPEGMIHYNAKAIVLAMGCRERPRGAINIPGTRPAGIFSAGTVQRLLNIEGYRPGNTAVVLGSGDIGLIMARRLTLEGIKVPAVVELLSYSCGLTRNLVQCLEDFQIPLLLNHTVIEIFGEQRVSGVRVAPVGENRQPLQEQSFVINCDTLVLSVGLIPENELSLMSGVELDPATGGPLVNSDYQTSVSGIFACGNVVHVHDLVDDVSEEGEVTGRAVAVFLKGRGRSDTGIVVKPGRNIRAVVPQRIFSEEPTTLYIRAQFPERDAILMVGEARVKQRVVAPGETIRYTIKPDEIKSLGKDGLGVSLEQGGANHYV